MLRAAIVGLGWWGKTLVEAAEASAVVFGPLVGALVADARGLAAVPLFGVAGSVALHILARRFRRSSSL